ncbi:solute carrier family 25 member 36 [Egretta garzetta]|uniref:solute carrier family 25 member 36 n=1 Tax=Egretta garzetta TaxID=188379 RepID=UPI00163CF06A|nr:solute carrier family 25 member 36 [Egretta garzetta]
MSGGVLDTILWQCPPYDIAAYLPTEKIFRIPSNCFSKHCPVIVFSQLLDKKLKLHYSDFLDVLICHHCTQSSPELETTLLVKKTTGLCGGTAGAILTCPLEVVKTRLQSSQLTLRPLCLSEIQLPGMSVRLMNPTPPSPGVLKLLRAILEKEGVRSLFRGLGPNLVGVAPSRAIYFAAYSGVKERLNAVLVPESKKVHMLSAACAGITSATLTNPIWLVKTRMQLEARAKGEVASNALQCAMHVYRTEGLRGFYRGITASYAGVSETIIHFVIYEALKQQLRNSHHSLSPPLTLSPNSHDFFGLMGAAAVSKTCASCIAYPHEVIRTRLREEGSRYRSFIQTLQLVVHEEGPLALYRGLLAHLIRQIPNTAIMMATYELIVHLASSTL